MGTPLVVTDAAGREPMVVMSLQAYERLSEGSPQVSASVSKVAALKSEPEVSAYTEPVSYPVNHDNAPEPAQILQEIAIQVMETPEMAQDSEISMEERFYLEPDENGSK